MNEKVFDCLERFYWIFVIISGRFNLEFRDSYSEIKTAINPNDLMNMFFQDFSYV